MMAPQTPRGRAIAEQLRAAFADLAELERSAPADVDAIVASSVSHLRSWRPESVTPLSELAAPTESDHDPRGPR
jgi:hypothetical protein